MILSRPLIIALMSASVVQACGKGAASNSSAQPSPPAAPSSPAPDNSSTSTDTTVAPGTLAVTGSLNLTVAALSSAASFTASNAAQAATVATSAKPGTLALSAALVDSPTHADLLDTCTTVVTAPDFKSNSIVSGPPDGFKIKVTGISLSTEAPASNQVSGILNAPQQQDAQSLDDQAPAPGASPAPGAAGTVMTGTPAVVPVSVFSNKDGTELSVESGTVNLGALAGTFTVPVGEYAQLSITLLRQAQIEGCVSGDFVLPGGTVAGGANITGPHTFCTVPGYSDFDQVKGTNAIFENATKAYTSIDIASVYDASAKASDTVTYNFPLNPPLKVTKGDTVDLSLVFDLNRMLRFYTMNRIDQGANPNAPQDRSYFFTSIFDQSFYAFAGKPGRIYGYQLIASNCPAANLGDVSHPGASGQTCNGSTTGFGAVGGWLTIVTAPDGHPLMINLSPNDDNDLTIIKGGINGVSPYLSDGTTAGMVDIQYALNPPTLLGKLLNFNPNLDDTPISCPLGGAPGFSANPGGNNEQAGPLYVKRLL